MRLILFLISVTLMLLTSCSTSSDLQKRKYTDGFYHDLSLDVFKKEKDKDKSSETQELVNDTVQAEATCFKEKMNQHIVQPVVRTVSEPVNREHLHTHLPAKADSMLAHHLAARDTGYFDDSIPNAISVALVSQASLGVAALGGAIITAAPATIWFFWLPIIIAPLSLLVTLISAGIAFGQLASGKADKRFKKYMRLWAVGMVVNLALGLYAVSYFWM
jgi:hypothetical protein